VSQGHVQLASVALHRKTMKQVHGEDGSNAHVGSAEKLRDKKK